MIEAIDKLPDPDVVHRYEYDALGRRIAKITDFGGPNEVETRYYYSGARVIEEQDGNGDTFATYVYGNYIDEVISMRRDVDGDGTPEDYFYLCDDNYNVMALTDAAGNVVERYEYGDYGQPVYMDANWTTLTSAGSQYGNPYLFTGRRFDDETKWYYYRSRYLDPFTGRFTTRDPIGTWGDPANLGNAFTYVNNNPWSMVDPLGLEGFWSGAWDVTSGAAIGVWRLGKGIVVGGYHLVRDPYGVGYDIGTKARMTYIGFQSPQSYGYSPHRALWETVSAGGGALLGGNSFLDAGVAWEQGNLREATAQFTQGTGQFALTYVGGRYFVTESAPIIKNCLSSKLFGTPAPTPRLTILNPCFKPDPTRIVGSGNVYSVAFRVQLTSDVYLGTTRGFHYQQANVRLLRAIDGDPVFARQMETLIPELRTELINPRSISRQPPKGWTWHHHIDEGVLELIPRVQHEAPSPLQQLLHPGGKGGMSIWGN